MLTALGSAQLDCASVRKPGICGSLECVPPPSPQLMANLEAFGRGRAGANVRGQDDAAVRFYDSTWQYVIPWLIVYPLIPAG